MRLCILTYPSPCTWVQHYIAAFRAVCDTIVVGPQPDAATLEAWGRDDAATLTPQSDITCDFRQGGLDLLTLLPSGWTPDLVVGISGLGGDPLYADVARLPWPTAFITVDTWQCLNDYRQAIQYDFVFAAQREFVPLLQAAGSRHVFWLPLACDPDMHRPADVAPTHDIAFAGSATLPVHAERRRLLRALAGRFSVLARDGVYGPQMCRTMARGRIVFNHSAVQEVNMRIFEALAMGRPLLTNRAAEANGLFDLFRDGTHLVAYDSETDLMEKAATLLADATGRGAIAAAGRAEVLARHTYAHRVQTLLETVRSHLPATPPSRRPAFEGLALENYLPNAPGVVVDLGLWLGVSRVGLRRRGVSRLIGIPADMAEATRRRGSYDEMLPLIAAPVEQADTVVAAVSDKMRIPLEDLIWRARQLLRPGGVLVLGFRPEDLHRWGLKPDAATMGPWFEAREFHLRLIGPPLSTGGRVILARKRTRRLAAIVSELYHRLDVPGLDIGDVLRRIPPGW